MKRFQACLLFIALLPFLSFASPGEGMWIPSLLKEYQESEMRASGMRLTAEDIYSINHSSLKDAILLFGGGCTGSVISDQGLLITNHHCGYSNIQFHSSLEHNYLEQGFWAKSKEEELMNPGLKVTFIIRIEDVTARMLEGISEGMPENERQDKIRSAAAAIEKEFAASSGYEAKVRPFYNGNEFYLFLTETFRDVRLVGAPPNSIGNYGRDTDNWSWPRHTADFSLFRIYANKENKPADPSADNVPWKPRRVLDVSIKGVQEGDFTMVYGFPGRTTEYLSSYEVSYVVSTADPVRVNIREKKLAIMNKYMNQDAQVKIQYSAKYARVANYWKKWKGEMDGLKANDAVAKKEAYEKRFRDWLSNSPEANGKYADILPAFAELFGVYRPAAMQRDYYSEAGMAIEMLALPQSLLGLADASLKKKPADEIDKLLQTGIAGVEGFFKDYYLPLDREMATEMLKMYKAEKGLNALPSVFTLIDTKFGGSIEAYVNDLYEKSLFPHKEKLIAFLKNYKPSQVKKLQADPGWVLMQSIASHYQDSYAPELMQIQAKLDVLNRRYMSAQREMEKDRKFYPDANGTLRVTWGKVEGFQPRDAERYNWYSTLDGVIQKYIPGDVEFDLPQKLIDLWKTKDYGVYGTNGEMRVNFIASNHTSGGNSGSPVFNGNGEFIGINFDRVWEGTMSDIMFDPSRCRNITADARYILFIIDKFGDAGHLVKEMHVVR